MGLAFVNNPKRFYKLKKSIELTDQQFDDLVSAVDFTKEKYPKKGAEDFLASLSRIEKKLWKVIRRK